MAEATRPESPAEMAARQASRLRRDRRNAGQVDADAELGLAVLKLLRSNEAVTREMLVKRFTRVLANARPESLDAREAEAILHRLEPSATDTKAEAA